MHFEKFISQSRQSLLQNIGMGGFGIRLADIEIEVDRRHILRKYDCSRISIDLPHKPL
jgi:hypothetical protein